MQGLSYRNHSVSQRPSRGSSAAKRIYERDPGTMRAGYTGCTVPLDLRIRKILLPAVNVSLEFEFAIVQ